MSARHSTTKAGLHRLRRARFFRVPRNERAEIHQQAAVAIFGQAGEAVDVDDFDARALQGLDQRIGQPLRQLVEGDDLIGRVGGADLVVTPGVAERNARERELRGPDRPEMGEDGGEDFVRLATPRRKRIQQPPRPRAIPLRENLRRRQTRTAQPVEQIDATSEADERIVAIDLKARRQVSRRDRRKTFRVGARSGSSFRAENAPAANMSRLAMAKPSERDEERSVLFAIAPARPGAGVEQDADDRQIEFGAGAGACVRPARALRDRAPATPCRPPKNAASAHGRECRERGSRASRQA